MPKYRILMACWLFIFPCHAYGASNAFIPPSGKTLLVVGQDRDTIAYYVHGSGHVPGGTMFYTSLQDLEGLQAPIDYGSGSQDGGVLLRTYPNSAVQIGLYLVDELDKTLAGAYDDHLKVLAQWIKDAHRPVYLRIGYEFDLPVNHYDPQQYKQTFRYIVDFLRKEGVHNAAYVWHTYCSQIPNGKWLDWYPGDDYVDWFGVSLFVTEQIPEASNFQKLAREHGKPFMICESTPKGLYTVRGKIDWFNHIFKFIEAQNVQIFCYINTNWDSQKMWSGQNWGDARIEKNIETKELWLKEMANERYLKATPDLFRLLGWKTS